MSRCKDRTEDCSAALRAGTFSQAINSDIFWLFVPITACSLFAVPQSKEKHKLPMLCREK